MPAVETVRGGAVRLFEHTDGLGIAEGIETAVAAHELFGLPTWATISSTIMESFVPPAGVATLLAPVSADSRESPRSTAGSTAPGRKCSLPND